MTALRIEEAGPCWVLFEDGTGIEVYGPQRDKAVKLIKVAPDLLAALQGLCNGVYPSAKKWDAARAAIAKATGE